MRKLILLLIFTSSTFGIIFGQTNPASKNVNKPEVESKKTPSTDLDNLVGLKGEVAPIFTLPSMNGTEYSLEKLRGKVVVINLWGTFCAPCLEEMPKLNSMVENYNGKNVVFLAPAPDEKKVLEGFLNKYSFSYQILPNAFSLIRNYAPHQKSDDPNKKGSFVMLLPTHLVIDQKGTVTYHEWGFRKDTIKSMTDEIDRLLAENKAK